MSPLGGLSVIANVLIVAVGGCIRALSCHNCQAKRFVHFLTQCLSGGQGDTRTRRLFARSIPVAVLSFIFMFVTSLASSVTLLKTVMVPASYHAYKALSHGFYTLIVHHTPIFSHAFSVLFG